MKKILIIATIILTITSIIVIDKGILTSEVISNYDNEESSYNEADNDNMQNQELGELIDNYLNTNNINQENIGIAITNLSSNEYYVLNSNKNFTAASVYKLPLAMIYYEMTNSNEVNLDDTYLYTSIHYEYGGPIAEKYNFGDEIPLEEILESVILYSDNSAGHILFENLDGWENFKTIASKYSTIEQNDAFYTENVLSASYTNDVLLYLHNNQDIFKELIDDMDNAEPNNYLNYNSQRLAIQKYGIYENSLNSAGIVFGDNTYCISIFTTIGIENEFVLADINDIVNNYYKKNSL